MRIQQHNNLGTGKITSRGKTSQTWKDEARGRPKEKGRCRGANGVFVWWKFSGNSFCSAERNLVLAQNNIFFSKKLFTVRKS